MKYNGLKEIDELVNYFQYPLKRLHITFASNYEPIEEYQIEIVVLNSNNREILKREIIEEISGSGNYESFTMNSLVGIREKGYYIDKEAKNYYSYYSLKKKKLNLNQHLKQINRFRKKK